MASLKEVKNRIASVNSTRKITSAMKMVASSKLHRAQQAIGCMLPYEKGLSRIMSSFLTAATGEIESPYASKREIKRAAVVVFTSNSSLCGGFNSNIIREAEKKIQELEQRQIEVRQVYAFGRKGEETLSKHLRSAIDIKREGHLLEHPQYDAVVAVAEEIMDAYVHEDIDMVVLLYHHFKNTASQQIITETYLPVSLEANSVDSNSTKKMNLDYIFEPDAKELLTEIVPKTLHLKLFAAMLDSLASEHAARVIAMQVATDNADELLRELTLKYNKTRQQAITTELLDIVGGSMQ